MATRSLFNILAEYGGLSSELTDLQTADYQLANTSSLGGRVRCAAFDLTIQSGQQTAGQYLALAIIPKGCRLIYASLYNTAGGVGAEIQTTLENGPIGTGQQTLNTIDVAASGFSSAETWEAPIIAVGAQPYSVFSLNIQVGVAIGTRFRGFVLYVENT